MSKLTAHFYATDKGKMPDCIKIGPKDPTKYECAIIFRGTMHQILTMQDRADIVTVVTRILNDRKRENNKGAIILPGTGLIIPANTKPRSVK